MTENELPRQFHVLVERVEMPVFVLDESEQFIYVSSELSDALSQNGSSSLDSVSAVEADAEQVFSDDVLEELEPVLDSESETEQVTIQLDGWDEPERPFEVVDLDGEILGYPSQRWDEQYDESAEFARVLEQLHEVTNRLYGAGSVAEGLDIVIEAAVEVLGFDWCLLMEATGGVFEVRAMSSESPVDVGDTVFSTDEGLAGATYQSGEPRLTSDARQSETANPTHPFIRSSITVPVGSWGVFQAHSRTAGLFDERDQQLAETLIAPLATMIERIERESALRESTTAHEQQRRQIEALHTVATRMKTASSRQEVYEMTIEAVEEILQFDICLIDEVEGDVLVPKAVGSNMSVEDYYEETPIDKSNNLGSLTYRRGETFVVDDLQEAGFAPAQSQFTSALSLALDDWGIFQIVSEEGAAFDRTDRRLAELLVEHAVAAIDRIDHECEIERRAGELEQQNERLDEFASIVSHDLRNPLNVASLRTEHAIRTGDIESLEAVENALDRMETIVEDVLTLARHGGSVGDTQPLRLSRVTKQCWRRVPVDDASLDVVEDVVVVADENRLGHLFENLFRNAVEHGGEDVTVEVGPLPSSEGFYVEDDGPGIDEAVRDQVFDRGFSESETGTGLGLAIVEEVVEAHDWEVRVTNGSIGGARFEVSGVDVEETVRGDT